jgi:hypothetical protein
MGCLLVAVLSVTALAYPPLPLLTLLRDSEQYREIGEALLSGHLLDAPAHSDRTSHVATSLRPPLFPLLLGIASLIPGVSSQTALVTLHIMLGALAIGVAPFILTRAIHPLITTLAAGFSIYSVKQVAWGIMSEWLGMVWLFLSCVLYLAWVYRPSPRLALGFSVGLSLAILTRTAFLPWLALLPFATLQAPRGSRRVTATALATGLLPLVLWGAVNLQRTGYFSLVPYEGLNLLATARSLGEIPLSSTDSEAQRHLIKTLNEKGVTASDSALIDTEVHRWDGGFYAAFHRNFDVTTDSLQALEPTSEMRASEIATRGLIAHRDRYKFFLRGGKHTFFENHAPLILTCILTTLWLARRAPRYSRWCLGVMTISVVSVGYLAAILGTMLWLDRYLVPVQPVLLFCTIVSMALVLTTFVRPGRTTTN